MRGADPDRDRRGHGRARARTRCGPTPIPSWPGGGSAAPARPIAALLMDQTILSGVGNVYRAEVLFRNRVDPHRPGNKLTRRSWLGIWTDLVDADARGGARQPDRHRSPRAHAGGDGPSAARRRPRRRGLRLPPQRACRAGSAEPRCGPRCWPAATCSGAVGVSAGAERIRWAVGLSRCGLTGRSRRSDPARTRPAIWSAAVWSGSRSAGPRCPGPHRPWQPTSTRWSSASPRRPGLGLVVRHSFTADWAVRIAFVNHTLEPVEPRRRAVLGTGARLPGLGAGRRGDRGVRDSPVRMVPAPLLGGELVLGTCDEVSDQAIGLGRVELGPLERRVVQWRWAWYAGPRAFNRNRFAAVPRDLVLFGRRVGPHPGRRRCGRGRSGR